MKQLKTLIMLVLVLISALFIGCSNQDTIDDGFKPIDEEKDSIIETPDEVLNEELMNADDEVEIGELI